jgi:hypothetical protein
MKQRKLRGEESARRDDESGAVLILALIYLVSVLIVVTALTGWVTNDLNNTAHFSSASSTTSAVGGTMNVAIASIRTTPLLPDSQTQGVASPLTYCWTPDSGYVSEQTLDNTTVAVWCSTVENLSSTNTRVVSLYACPTTLTPASSSSDAAAAATQCQSSPRLQTVVTFDDYPPGGSSALTKQCTLWCGQGMYMQSWVWQ